MPSILRVEGWGLGGRFEPVPDWVLTVKALSGCLLERFRLHLLSCNLDLLGHA